MEAVTAQPDVSQNHEHWRMDGNEIVFPSALDLTSTPGGEAVAPRIRSGKEEWFWYARGYLNAAEVLNREIQRNPAEHELLAAPMMFAYRHHIELHLKHLLAVAGEILDQPQDIPPQHFVLSLWKRVRALLLSFNHQREDSWWLRADQIVGQFDAIDIKSMAWRYPVDREGQASLPPDFRVDPAVVRRVVAELSTLLEGASAQMALLGQLKLEIDSSGSG
jgi:hypothetical protein